MLQPERPRGVEFMRVAGALDAELSVVVAYGQILKPEVLAEAFQTHGYQWLDSDPYREDYRRWERAVPMELWQMDIVGGVRLADGVVVVSVQGAGGLAVLAGGVELAQARGVPAHLVEGVGPPHRGERLRTAGGWPPVGCSDEGGGGEEVEGGWALN